jgi:Amt family ammonium transporter
LTDLQQRLAMLQDAVARIDAISTGADALAAKQEDFQTNLDTNWVIITFALVFSMQIGSALFEAGNARRKNVMGILFKNVAGTIITGLMWWGWGWALSFGYNDSRSLNGFVGNAELLLVSEGKEFPITKYAFWAFQFALCNEATHILFRATSERLTMFATYAYSFIFSCFIYPVIAHWIWSGSGWLSSHSANRVGENGLIDFSGATVVHLCGGFAALAGALLIKPRTGRFTPEEGTQFSGQSSVLRYLGTLFLWFGWYGFATGGSFALSDSASEVVAKVAITTTLSAGAAALTVFAISRGNFSRTAAGALAGLVSISGACSVVEPWAAVVIGIIGGLTFILADNTIQNLKVDDPSSTFAIHGASGMWGTLAVGVFATQYNTQRTLGRATNFYGFLYGGGANQFGTQFLGMVLVALWAFVWTAVVMIVLNALGRLRVSEEVEALGTDSAAKPEAYAASYLGLVTPQDAQESQAVLA